MLDLRMRALNAANPQAHSPAKSDTYRSTQVTPKQPMASPQYNTPQHKALRKQYRRVVDAGNGWCAELICLMPSRHIAPYMPFDLAHDRATGGHLGAAHPLCNRAEGGRHRHAKNKRSERWEL